MAAAIEASEQWSRTSAVAPLAVRLSAAIAILIAAVVLAGWALDVPRMRTILPGLIGMQPGTAIAMLCGGIGLLALDRPAVSAAIPSALGGAVLLLALLALVQFVGEIDLGVDRAFFAQAIDRQPYAMAHPGRMAEPTAICFALIGLSLLLSRARARAAGVAYSALATAVIVPVLLTLLGILFDEAPLPGVFGFTNVALPTATGLGALAVGLLAARPDVGWIPLLCGDTLGAAAARRLLPIVVIVPTLTAWLALQGARERLYSSELLLALVTGVSIFLLAAVTIWAADRFNRLEAISRTEQALRETEQRLSQARAELLHASRQSEIGAFGSALAHELNQPLTAIAIDTDTARQMIAKLAPKGYREIDRVLDHAHASAIRAAEIIRRMRNYVTAGEIDRSPQDLQHIIEDAVIVALTSDVLGGIATEFRLDAAARWVLADPIQIQQVVSNLVRNAAEAMAGGDRRRVIIETRRLSGSMVEVSVLDTGPGLGDADGDQLFSSFFTTKGAGMGLGLSICRTIVEAHGGEIRAESTPDGAAFRFTLPAAPRPRSDPALRTDESGLVEEEEVD
jgi:signal transduction histidine kinase